ncbi:endonuclease VII domain-containing protein [Pseudofrankia sp. BMG5.37]|uniref:endonuclease VII domain-containing protein n=1 Tax=Pseudofrankia sp. BMG5.37 TaxID=3050035 RepID=UPI002893B9CE|nr:endonuclease VII domain-containing protein [Pseudofrankia sp. BMG5.37]MDT3441697.1 endonuclease VII domain-containing protein [Pseudofrankia sp. BMG5.37]
MITKACRDCGVEKPLDQFHRDPKARDGRHSYCIECFRRRGRERYYRRKAGDLTNLRRTRPLVSDGYRVCPDCGERKPAAEFAAKKNAADGLHTYSRPCNNARSYASARRLHGSTRSRALLLRYGLTEQDVEAMVAEQRGLCAICVERPAAHVDHDHRAGWVRGVLCFTCNVGLGNFGDDEYGLRLAARYLRMHQHRGSPLMAAQGFRVCMCCGKRKPFADFAARRSEGAKVGEDRMQPCCSACLGARGRGDSGKWHGDVVGTRIRRRFGLTESQVDALVAAQGAACAVCRIRPPEHVDHDHASGRIRGILCFTCNTGMGNFGDDPNRLLLAANYLKGDACRIQLVV